MRSFFCTVSEIGSHVYVLTVQPCTNYILMYNIQVTGNANGHDQSFFNFFFYIIASYYIPIILHKMVSATLPSLCVQSTKTFNQLKIHTFTNIHFLSLIIQVNDFIIILSPSDTFCPTQNNL